MRRNVEWLKTAILTNRIPKPLGEITKEEAIRDGFEDENECIWGLLEVNHLLPKKLKTQEEIKKRLDWALQLFGVLYQWKPIQEGYDPKKKLPFFTFTHFIPKIIDESKTQTIRLHLKKIVPGQKIWLMRKVEPKEVFDKFQTTLERFNKK